MSLNERTSSRSTGCRVASKLMRERMIEHAKHLWAMRQVTLRVKDDETGDEAKPISMET